MSNNSHVKQQVSLDDSQIILYQPNETISLEVKLEQETVWLTQAQMVELFGSSKANVSEHIANIYQQKELTPEATVRNFRTVRKEGNRMVTRNMDYYNLDMIISVGFRVNSQQGIRFRQWANNVLKEYLLRGYAVHQQLVQMEQRIDTELLKQHDEMVQIMKRQDQQQQQLDFFIRTNTPPAELVFFNGEFFTARVAIENLIKMATRRAIIIDHYVDATTFEHNRQVGVQPVEVYKWRVEPHDRFLIIDDRLYHCGHSLNATGKKLSAIMQMGISPEVILSEMV